MTDAADRQKAYRERMKAEGKRAITIYIPEIVYQEIKGNPQVIIDSYVNRNKGGLFNDQGLRTAEVQAIKDKVDAIEVKLSCNLVSDRYTEIDQAVTEIRKRVALLQTEQDNLVTARNNLVKRCDSLQIDNNENKSVLNALQTKYDDMFKLIKELESKISKKAGTKFEPSWYDEYLATNEGKAGKDRMSETAFANLKRVHKSTISRGFAKIRKERADSNAGSIEPVKGS